MTRDYHYYRIAFAGIPKPFAFLDLDLLDQNIDAILKHSGDKQIRIASKSIRSVEVLRYIMAKSDRFLGIMCYTIDEAVFLAEEGFHDLLVAYPAYDIQQIQSAVEAVGQGHLITLMVDSIPHVKQIEKIASRAGVCMPICLDIDMSVSYPGLHFGVRRSPLNTKEKAMDVVNYIASSRHIRLDGVMGYEAQVAGLGDQLPKQQLKSKLIRFLKKQSLPQIEERRAEAVGAIQKLGLSLRFVNGGGTGSLQQTSQEQVVTEVTAGSGFYSPLLFDYYQDFRYQPAAGFAIEITRRPTSKLYTCLGGGYIASGKIGPEKAPQPYLPVGAKLLPLEGAGEVQTPIQYTGKEELQLGDPILMRHSKAGEYCERFTHLYWISDGQVVKSVPTYRGQGKCFL